MSRRAAIGRFKANRPGSGRGKVTRLASLIKTLTAAVLDAVGSVFTPASSSWNVLPTPTFDVGEGDTYDISLISPPPDSYKAGGVYDVDASGSTLPSGITLSDGGLLTDTGATAGLRTGIIFGYTEPAALPILTLHPTITGTLPYVATVYPSESAVPSGRFIVSPDDPNLRSSVLSAWPDGSAQVMVVASRGVAVSSGVTKTINLRLNKATDTAGAALADSRVAEVVSTIAVNFSGTPQTLTLNGATKDWTWWANSEVICNRYRMSCGLGDMEAVIDVHAFAGSPNRAWVEVVIENGKMNASAATVAKPVVRNYIDATVKVTAVGGVETTIATVSSKVRGQSLRSAYNRLSLGTEVSPNANPEWTGIYEFALTPPENRNPPQTPVIGRKYALGPSGPSGTAVPNNAWTGHAGDRTEWDGSQWVFTAGSVGQIVNDVAALGNENPYVWTGQTWTLAWNGGHEAFRSWYCSADISASTVTPKGSGTDVFGIEVTHDTASLQAHPWFFRPMEPTAQNMTTKYQRTYDTYVPWATCRIRVPGMGGGGDDEQVATITEDQCDYVITGSKYVSRAVISTGLGCHSVNWHYRHLDGKLPTRTQMTGKNQDNNFKWPRTDTEPRWDGSGAHTPFIAVVPFLCRPSPCFIELAQKEFCWNATHYGSGLVDAAAHRYDEVRARAWRIRNYAGSIWLTPDEDFDGTGRKESLRAALAANIAVHNAFLDAPWNTLKVIWSKDLDGGPEDSYSNPGWDTSWFMHDYVVTSWSTVDRVKVLRGADQTAWTAMCDKIVDMPVRYINQATAGEWRAILYVQYLGQPIPNATSATSIDMGVGDFGERNRIIYGASVPAATGPWLMDPESGPRANWASLNVINTRPSWANAATGSSGSSYNYDALFWAAFVAAVERNVSGADAAWNKVYGTVGATPTQAGSDAGITNFQTWRTGFNTYPKQNRYPRNKV